MANIFQSNCCFSLATYITAIAFTTVAISPPPLMAAGVNLDLAAINFGIRIEKLYEKVKKSINRGETNKIVGYMSKEKVVWTKYVRNAVVFQSKTLNVLVASKLN